MGLRFNNSHWTEQHNYYIITLDALSTMFVLFVLKPVHIATFCYYSVVGSVYLKHSLYNSTDSFQIGCEQLAGSSFKFCSAVKIALDYVVAFPFFTVAVMNI